MKTKRVNCDECINFIKPSWLINFNIIPLNNSESAKCSLGKRVMFRSPIGDNWTNAGWIRYCNDFKKKENE